MSNKVIFIAFATLMALTGCKQTPENAKAVSLDRDNNDKIEYVIDYTVRFAADHDSTMQLTASGNYGTVKIAQVESENLIGEYGKPVKNTFIILEDTVPLGKSITLHRGGLSYAGGKPEFIHNNTIGSDDLVELRILDINAFPHSHTNASPHSQTNALTHSHTNAIQLHPLFHPRQHVLRPRRPADLHHPHRSPLLRRPPRHYRRDVSQREREPHRQTRLRGRQ